MSVLKFSGRRAVVTGGNRGMGRGIATALAEGGAEVCIVARDENALAETRRDIESRGATCHSISADLATIDGAERAAAEVRSIDVSWDMLVNCAGSPPGPHLLEMDLDYWERTFGVHCRAPFILARALVPAMIERGNGSILNISSVASLLACWGHGAYSSAKVGLNMLTRTMALEWGRHGVRANAICPTAVMTEMGREVWTSHPVQAEWLRAKIPAGRLGEVKDVVGLAMFLLDPENTFINGTVIPCDGGLLAGLADGPPTGD
jgi:2-deoxy-D-gluconate 3-dehydrogenase